MACQQHATDDASRGPFRFCHHETDKSIGVADCVATAQEWTSEFGLDMDFTVRCRVGILPCPVQSCVLARNQVLI